MQRRWRYRRACAAAAPLKSVCPCDHLGAMQAAFSVKLEQGTVARGTQHHHMAVLAFDIWAAHACLTHPRTRARVLLTCSPLTHAPAPANPGGCLAVPSCFRLAEGT